MLLADGEAGAEIYSAATKRDQAKITWDEAARMVRKSPHLLRHITVHKDRMFLKWIRRPSTNRSGATVTPWMG